LDIEVREFEEGLKEMRKDLGREEFVVGMLSGIVMGLKGLPEDYTDGEGLVEMSEEEYGESLIQGGREK
jgi:hypothetical protein